MSKKKFKDGLESLFGPTVEETLQEDSPLLVETSVEKPEPTPKRTNNNTARRSARTAKKSSSKNFTSDLDSLFESALQETLEEKAQTIVEEKPTKTFARKRTSRPLSGLDALIRRTVEDSMQVTSGKKRVTFVFDREKLIKLKRIAKLERSYLKDIIGDVMSQFIDQYEQSHDDIDYLME